MGRMMWCCAAALRILRQSFPLCAAIDRDLVRLGCGAVKIGRYAKFTPFRAVFFIYRSVVAPGFLEFSQEFVNVLVC